MKTISQGEIDCFLLKSTVFRASHWNLLFHYGLLTGFLLLGDRGRPSYLEICIVNQYLSIFAKHFIGFIKREKYGRKISRKVKLKVFCSNLRSSGLPIEILVSWRASNGLPSVRRPWKAVRLRYRYINSISKHFLKTFHRFQKARKIWEKNISQSEIKSFLLKSTVFRASQWNPLFHDGLLTVFLLLEDRGRPSDLDICTVTQYLSIFAKYWIGFRKLEKYGRKISRKVKLNVFCSNPRSSGLPIEIFCFITGF